MTTTPVVSVDGLRKSFGDREAVRDVSFEISPGECVGLLGHNGAGKTVTIEMLEGYLARDAGSVSVLGVDPARATGAWRERIGVVLQEVEVFPTLSVTETVRMFADLYTNPRPVEQTIELVGLSDARSSRVGMLSGGQKRRLDIALGLVGDPELLFLDEPTTGLDPAARREAWTMIDGLTSLGMTILLTTHYMDEAQVLADRLLILREGEIAAAGTYDELAARHGDATSISFDLPAHVTVEAVRAAVGVQARRDGPRVELSSPDPQRDLFHLTAWAQRDGVSLGHLTVRRSSLEDVFLSLGAEPSVPAHAASGTPR
ncbi:MAG: ABC transporter ATP-binding protein [Jiangellales bacterium]